MSDLKSGLITVALSGLCGVLAIVGCTADGSQTVLEDDPPAPSDPVQPGAQLPAGAGGGGAASDPGSTTDAGKPPTSKDSGAKDSSVDAGPPPPAVGAPCSALDEIKKKRCGACGSQSTVCLASGDGGGGAWSTYSQCEGELVGGCVPGTVVDEACGNCGTVKKTCTQYCAFSATTCSGQPADSCVPGTVDLTGAGCTEANQFRQRECTSSCVYKNFGMTCEAPPGTVEVGPTPGSVTYTIAILSDRQTLPRIGGTCPTSLPVSPAVVTPYVYLKVHNPLPRAAEVAIYNSLAPGGQIFDTVLAAYQGAVSPTEEAARAACLSGVSTYGNSTLTGNSSFAALDGSKAVTIAPGATVSVYVAAEKAYDPNKPAASTGVVKLNVQTVSLE